VAESWSLVLSWLQVVYCLYQMPLKSMTISEF
jgi:hypothetical protein